MHTPSSSELSAMSLASICSTHTDSYSYFAIAVVPDTIYTQIFEVRNFHGWTIFRIFAILFLRIAFHLEKIVILFSRIACPQNLSAAEIACLCIVT